MERIRADAQRQSDDLLVIERRSEYSHGLHDPLAAVDDSAMTANAKIFVILFTLDFTSRQFSG